MEKVYAIIPARGGSKGVPGKNIRPLAGYPLIAYSIAAAKMSKTVDRVIISTDSEEIGALAKEFGAEVPFLRPPEISLDTSKDSEFMLHAVKWFEENENNCPEYWVHLRPTTPLRNPVLMDNAIKEIMADKSVDCLRSAHLAPESPFKWFLKNSDGYFSGLSTQVNNEQLNDPRQGFPDAYIPDGYVDVLRTSFMKETSQIHGEKMMSYISPYCVEVDTLEEFDLLEYYIGKNGSVLLDFLKSYRKE